MVSSHLMGCWCLCMCSAIADVAVAPFLHACFLVLLQSCLESPDGLHNVDLATAARDFVHNPLDIRWLPRAHSSTTALWTDQQRTSAFIHSYFNSTPTNQWNKCLEVYSVSCSTCSVSLLCGVRVITSTVHKIWWCGAWYSMDTTMHYWHVTMLVAIHYLPPLLSAHCVSSTSLTVPVGCRWICGSRSQRVVPWWAPGCTPLLAEWWGSPGRSWWGMASSHLLQLSTQWKGGQTWQLAELSPSFFTSLDMYKLHC